MFLNKPKVKYNILNDINSDVSNLFWVVINDKESLLNAFKIMPIHKNIFDFWKKNLETDPIKKALRFLLLSNFGYMGKPDTLRYNGCNTAQIIMDSLEKTHKKLFGCEFSNFCFRELFKRIPFKNEFDLQKAFIYCDPPYLYTNDNYSDHFNEQDCIDLFDVLTESKIKFAYSEFDNDFIIEQAKNRGLNVITIGERHNLGKRKTEILITNYQNNYTLF